MGNDEDYRKIKNMRNDPSKLLSNDSNNTKELKDTLLIHSNIIEGLSNQKARTDDLLDKYMEYVEEETEIPSNRFMDWTKSVMPLVEQIKSSKLMDYEIIKRYEAFVSALIEHDNDFNITREEIEYMKDNADFLINVVLNLERKIKNKNNEYTQLITDRQLLLIRTYLSIPDEMKRDDDKGCIYCGVTLDENILNEKDNCEFCELVNEEDRPIIEKRIKKLPETPKYEEGEAEEVIQQTPKEQQTEEDNMFMKNLIEEIDEKYDKIENNPSS